MFYRKICCEACVKMSNLIQPVQRFTFVSGDTYDLLLALDKS